jgi:hypothetical protein
MTGYIWQKQIPVAARSKTRICCHFLAGISGSKKKIPLMA